MPKRKILIMGLPGAGKTTLAQALAPLLNAVVFNADEVRANIIARSRLRLEDRIEHARRMGWMCDRVVEAGGTVIADFICPTAETRAAFGAAFTIWVDRISAGRFEDTNRMFVAPEHVDLRVGGGGHAANTGPSRRWRGCGRSSIRRSRRRCSSDATSRSIAGHQRLIEEGLRRVGQVCIAVRDTHGIDDKNPLPFFAVKQRIEAALAGLRRPLRRGAAPQHHQRALWPRRRLHRRAHRPRRGDARRSPPRRCAG